MSKIYNLYSPISDSIISFTSEQDARMYIKAFPDNKYVLYHSQLVMNLNALGFINWLEIPKQYNFIYKDSDGVFASYYLPKKAKWFNSNYSRLRLYGGERVELSHKHYHDLIKLGEYFERPYGRTNHFIDWKKLKGSKFIKFVDDETQGIEVFNHEGELIYSGTNKDINIINLNATMRFNSFLWQTYTFERE